MRQLPEPPDAAAKQLRPVQLLIADLRDLTLDLEAGGYSPTTVAMFERDLRRAVPSALGATISFELNETVARPLKVNLLDRTLHPAQIGAALLIPLTPLRSLLSGSIVFYAGAPAAFDGLVLGLVLLLYTAPERIDQSPALPSEPLSRTTAGLQDFSLVNRALRVLLNRGYSLSEARSNIGDRAAEGDTDVSEAARAVLDTFPIRRRDAESDPPLPPPAS